MKMAENNAKWLDASYYQNIPNSEVNWAQLAQKWMQMRDAGEVPPVTSDDSIPPPPSKEPPPPHPPPASDGLPVNGSFLPPGGYLPTMPVDANFAAPSPCWIPPLPPSNFGPPAAGAFPPFMPPVPPWMGATPMPPGPFPPAPPYGEAKIGIDDEEGGEYSHYYKEWDEKQKSGRRDNDSDDSETVPEGAMAHWLKPGPGWAPPPNWYHPSRRDSPSNSHPLPFIDQQTRKALPAWIREGLEKAEQERQKKQTKEAKLRAAEEAAKARRAAKGLGKFDSDSSEDENGNEDAKERAKLDQEPVFLQKKKLEKQQEQPSKDTTEIDCRTEEETREDALMLLRRFMTEILLETTDDELNRIAREHIELAKRSAQPKVLAQSSALAALCTLGAESDDESSEETDMKQSDESNSNTKGEEFSKSNISGDGNEGSNEDDALFSVPLLPVLSSGAKSKAKLSSNDGFSSTESSQGVEKKKTAVQEKKNGDDASSRVAITKNEIDAYKEIDEKKLGSNIDEGNKRNKKEKHTSESKKQQQRKKSRSRERLKKRRRGRSREDSTKKGTGHASDSDRSESQTPERYRRRSSSGESYHKRRRSRSHKRLRSRSRSRTKRSRRFEERHNSRSRSRERRRSDERHHRDRHSRRSHS
uniref:BMA-RSY-1 n=3 Tax=Brugia TaxID=6278 RepID=A0A7I4KMY1_BRUMA